jgi:glycosyltransferase involved in cell wall biosynthesis
MDQSPLVSVIIPTYNDGNVVSDAIDCSLNQTYHNLEIIVVDDGSNDGTDRLVSDKYGSRIRYIRQENKGLSGARNTGLSHASGRYLQFLDADDLLDHTKISMQVKQLQHVSGTALAYCDYIFSFNDDVEKKYDDRMSPVTRKEAAFDDLMMKWETELSIPHHCFLFDAAVLREHRITYDESLPSHEDWEFLMNVFALRPTVVFIDQPLAIYRIRRNSMCKNRIKMREGYLQAINKQIQKYREDEEVVKKLRTRSKQIRHLYRDAAPFPKMMERVHPVIKKAYMRIVPGPIQRVFY